MYLLMILMILLMIIRSGFREGPAFFYGFKGAMMCYDKALTNWPLHYCEKPISRQRWTQSWTGSL